MSRIARCVAVAFALTFTIAAVARAQDGADDKQAAIEKIRETEKKAREAAKAKKWDEAAKYFEEMLALVEKAELPDAVKKRGAAGTHYNFACVLALSGKKDKALDELGKAIDLGFIDWKHIAKDADFDSIKDDDGFKKQVARAKEATEKLEAAEPKVPIAAFANAKEGDWATYRGKVSMNGALRRSILLARITKVEGDAVTLEIDQTAGGEKGPPKVYTFDRTKAPTIKRFFDFAAQPGARLEGVEAEETKESVSGKEFSGQSLSFVMKLGTAELKARTVFSTDVTAGGRVATKAEVRENDKKVGTISYEIAGYGTKDATTWGKSEADLEKEGKDDD